ncbi:hypothetical protein [Methylorubrum populi]
MPFRELGSELVHQALGPRDVSIHRAQLLNAQELSRQPLFAKGNAFFKANPLFLCSFDKRSFGHRQISYFKGSTGPSCAVYLFVSGG